MAKGRKNQSARARTGGSTRAGKAAAEAPFSVLAKPVGPLCNLRCEYCFYREKGALFPEDERYRMPADMLERFVRHYIRSQPGGEVEFAWQGGEPTLAGIDFYTAALSFQEKYRGAKLVRNSIQTNGTLLDDRWCEFLVRHGWLVGLSLDGPADVHDRYRRDREGGPTHGSVMRGLRLLRKHGVEFNVLTSVTDCSAEKPLEVYRFLRDAGAAFIQFQPIVERLPDKAARAASLRLAGPPAPDGEDDSAAVTPWSVAPEAYGEFFLAVFDEWVRKDVGKVFVMNFEWTLAAWMGLPAAPCTLTPRCGRCLAIEHNGDVYSCDHFVYPEYRLGGIMTRGLPEMLAASAQVRFGAVKETALPRLCRECRMLPACRGGCPKHRFLKTPAGEGGLNYLCKGFMKYLAGTRPSMTAMARLLSRGEPVTRIMGAPPASVRPSSRA